jgi:hypothetical protein
LIAIHRPGSPFRKMPLRTALAIGTLLIAVAGCGPGGKVAPVSGVVTLNGKPAEDVAVTFQPIPPDGNNAPGPSAFGVTGPDGRYSLKLMGEEIKGATLGKNAVRFSAYVPTDPNVDGPPKAKPKTSVPARYWSDSKIEFDVPPKGATNADFELKSP